MTTKTSSDGKRGTAGDVGRIFQRADGSWFWGMSFQLTGRKSYGYAGSLDAAKAAFRAEYEQRARTRPFRLAFGCDADEICSTIPRQRLTDRGILWL
jgi:hypothetical protein